MAIPLLMFAAMAAASAASAKRGSDIIGNTNINSGFDSQLGKDYEARLLRRMNTSPLEDPLFNQYMGRSERQVRSVTTRMEQKIKDSMPAGKQRDNLLKQLIGLKRGEQESLSGSAQELMLALEGLRDQGVFEFLSGEAADIQAQNALRLKQSIGRAGVLQRGAEGIISAVGSAR